MKAYLLVAIFAFFVAYQTKADQSGSLPPKTMLSYAFKAAGFNVKNIQVTESESVEGFAYRAGNAFGIMESTVGECETPYRVKEVHFDYNGANHNCQINYQVYTGNGVLDYHVTLQFSGCTTTASRNMVEKILKLNLTVDHDLSGYSNNAAEHKNGISAWKLACENQDD